MKKSTINFEVSLDDKNVPEQILWQASDQGEEGMESTKSISISIWDHIQRNTLRIDLWTKDMPVDEQKRFYIDCIGGLAQSILNATGDEFMASEMNKLCDRFIEHIQNENKKQQ